MGEAPATHDTTQDAFLGGAILVQQPRRGHRAGIDAVLLAAAAPVATGPGAGKGAGKGERVLDAGTGSGIVGLAVAARVPDAWITGVEIEPELAALARDNAARNGMTDRMTVVTADLTAPLEEIECAVMARSSFDHVLANPPFFDEADGTPSRDPLRQRANAMAQGGLDRWLRFLCAMAKPGGTLTLVHRTEELPAILCGLEGRFGGAVLFPLFPRLGQPAGRIIVQARKASRATLRLLPGLVLHEPDGRFTAQASDILRRGAPLALQATDRKP